MVEPESAKPPEYSRTALWGLCLTILALWPVLGVVLLAPGLVCVLVGLVAPGRAAFWRGRGLALAALLVLLPVAAIQGLVLPELYAAYARQAEQRETQTLERKVAQSREDLARLSQALLRFREDHGSVPPPGKDYMVPVELTTPVAYLAKLPADPFGGAEESGYRYVSDGDDFVLLARGPDGDWEDVAPQWLLIATPGERLRHEYPADAVGSASGDIILVGSGP